MRSLSRVRLAESWRHSTLPSFDGWYLGSTVSPKTRGLPGLVSCRANRTCGVSELETTGLFTASMTDNGLLILSESAIGERPTGKSQSNHTVHRAASEVLPL